MTIHPIIILTIERPNEGNSITNEVNLTFLDVFAIHFVNFFFLKPFRNTKIEWIYTNWSQNFFLFFSLPIEMLTLLLFPLFLISSSSSSKRTIHHNFLRQCQFEEKFFCIVPKIQQRNGRLAWRKKALISLDLWDTIWEIMAFILVLDSTLM